MDINENPIPEKDEKEINSKEQSSEQEDNSADLDNKEDANNEAEAKKDSDSNQDNSAKITAELSEMKDKYLRLYAEFDNYRKRTLREREDMIKTAAQDTIKSIIPTLDDFERAIKASKAEAENNSTIFEGVVLIQEKLLRTLEQQGLKAMESDGQPFNPDMHEALTKVPVPNEELKGKVIETIEKGYYLKDKIIRYAKVVVGQ
jgi:molecular chaperone GrpE